MPMTYKQLRALPDDEVERRYDGIAFMTADHVGIWHDEIERRSRERLAAASDRLARRGFWLSVISSITSVFALVVAVVTLVVTV